MKRDYRPSQWFGATTVAFALFVTITFQNCGKAGFDSVSSETKLSLGQVSAEKAASPFAYKATFDEISHMSCYNQGSDNVQPSKGYYTFHVGGFSSGGGINVTPEFLSYAKTNLKPLSPGAPITNDQIKQFLADTPINQGATVLFAGRMNKKLTSIAYPDSVPAPRYGTDYVTMSIDLTDDRMSNQLVSNGGVNQNFFPVAPIISPMTTRNFESRILYTNFYEVAGIREYLRSGGLLTLTFPTSISNTSPRSPGNADEFAYGTGYRISMAGNYTGEGVSDNLLTGVEEFSLENDRATGAQFTCDIRLRIFRKNEGCTAESAGLNRDAAYYARLARVRRHLKAEYWDVNLDPRYMCAVPKYGDCYPPTKFSNGTLLPVAYDGGACYDATNKSIWDGRTPPNNWCMNYVSICHK
jgi:hypothetical protein